MKENNNKEITKKEFSINRRNMIKVLASIPVFGAFGVSFFTKKAYQTEQISKHKALLKEIGLNKEKEGAVSKPSLSNSNKILKIGIIGYGSRGRYLIKSAGFVYPEFWNEIINKYKGAAKENAKKNITKSKKEFLERESLNIELAGVCDLFDLRAENALRASENPNHPIVPGTKNKRAKLYKNYKDMLASDEIDAVIIATPDHWHAQITIDAAKAGKHVYCEKAATITEEESLELIDTVKKSGIAYQLGHQNHQSQSHIEAQNIIAKNIIGDISLVEITTNRNSPNGAWYYDINPDGNKNNIDWNQFQANKKNKIPFSAERFFRWRLWWDYGTGLIGDLLSHEFAAINQILGMGIPHKVTSSGGIYFYDKNWSGNKKYNVTELREVPDVLQVTMEYPDRKMSIHYSATLANSHNRGKMIMGHDGMMEISAKLKVTTDRNSSRFKNQIKKGEIDPSVPLYSYNPKKGKVDGVTSATEKYFADKGLMSTYKDGKSIDTTYLHIQDWLTAIRTGSTPKCNIDLAFEEAITCNMATVAYREQRAVEWDPKKRRIV